MENLIQLTSENIASEHICCAFSDKKCAESYQGKKDWLTKEFENGYIFRRIDARAKVFIEYGPAEKAWLPIEAKNHLNINCFWVSGRYKKNGYGKALLQSAIDDAKAQNKDGLVTVVGTKKLHFMSDTKWFLKQGFKEVEKTAEGFSLLVYELNKTSNTISFKSSINDTSKVNEDGITVFYSKRCPYSEYHVKNSLVETAKKRELQLTIHKFESMEEAQISPTPATIFSLYYKGKFITTDISICMDSRFDKVLAKTK